MVEEKQAYEKKLEDKDKNLEEVETELKRTIFELGWPSIIIIWMSLL